MPKATTKPIVSSGRTTSKSQSKAPEELPVLTQVPRTKAPRKRPPVFSQSAEVQEHIIQLGAYIQALVELRHANGGTLPRGELERAAADLGKHKNGVLYLIHQFEVYRAHYPDSHLAEAFSPPARRGRPRRRDLPEEVTTFIQQALIKRDWLSLNHDGTTSQIDRHISARQIFAGAQAVFPEYADQLHLADVYHVLEDLERDNTEHVALARKGKKRIQDNLFTMNSTIQGANEQWQSDIRPLPIFVRYREIICTVRILYIIDQASKYILLWKLVPGKIESDGEYVVGDHITAQEFRELFALAMLRNKLRPRMLYADNGIQYRAFTLKPYMDAYTAAPGEAPTSLVNRRRRKPRGGGTVEAHLGDLDRFLQTRPGYFDEDDLEGEHGYRAIYAKIKRGLTKPRTIDELTKDLIKHIDYTNINTDNGPSRFERWQQGLDKSLSIPALENLLLFGKTKTKKDVSIQRYGLDYEKEEWVPENDTEEIRQLLLRAALSATKRKLVHIKLGDTDFIYVNLSEDGHTWFPFTRKKESKISIHEHNARNSRVQQRIAAANRQASSELDEFILARLGQPLVIDGSRQKLVASPLSKAATETASTNSSAMNDVASSTEVQTPTAAPKDAKTQDGVRGQKLAKRKTAKERTALQRSESKPEANVTASPQPGSEDDWSDFEGFNPDPRRTIK